MLRALVHALDAGTAKPVYLHSYHCPFSLQSIFYDPRVALAFGISGSAYSASQIETDS
jgi:hypothetical protein